MHMYCCDLNRPDTQKVKPNLIFQPHNRKSITFTGNRWMLVCKWFTVLMNFISMPLISALYHTHTQLPHITMYLTIQHCEDSSASHINALICNSSPHSVPSFTPTPPSPPSPVLHPHAVNHLPSHPKSTHHTVTTPCVYLLVKTTETKNTNSLLVLELPVTD